MQPDVAPALGAISGSEVILGDDVGDPDAAAGAEDAGDLGEHPVLLGREVDDAVRDHDVDARGRERDVLDDALEEVDVRGPGFPRVLLREREHLVGHVEAVDRARRARHARREEDVDAASRAEVEDGLALVELDHGERVAAAEARRDRSLGKRRRSSARVEALPEVVVASSPQQPMLSQSHPQPHPAARLVAASA